jgi:hypothetical protein
MVNTLPTNARQLSSLSAGASAKMARQSGADAVRQSVQQNTMSQNVRVIEEAAKEEDRILVRNSAQNQFVANKNFIQQSNVWVDSEFRPASKQTEVNLKFASEEYFAVLKREKQLSQYFALGEEVVVVWKDKVYRVTK